METLTLKTKRRFARNYVILTLTPNGFSIDDRFYSWHDIEQFGLTRKYGLRLLFPQKIVFWNFRPSSPNRNSEHKSSRLLSGYDEGIDVNYFVDDPEEIVRTLNDWRTRNTGLTSEIIVGTRLDRKISAKVYFLGIGLAIVVIVILALYTNVFTK
jgi:hypothetical protein